MIHTLKQLVPQNFKNLYHRLNAQLAVKFYGNPAKSLKVIGVTGTDGKTTTSTMIYHLLQKAGYKVALISTVNAYIGKERIDTGLHVTSPDPWQLQKLLKKILSSGMEYVVLESTSHGLDQHRLYGSNISIGVLTNITHEHLDYHKTFDHYRLSKLKLFQFPQVSLAVLNETDPSFSFFKSRLASHIEVKTYPFNLSSDLKKAITTRFPEKYNQLNAQAAIQVAKYVGVTEEKITQGIETFSGIPGRMEEIPNKLGIRVIVDFAHTPNALENVLTTLKKSTKGKLIAVYGSAGQRDQAKRPLMGKIGSEIADEVILTAEDPRTESVHTIIDQMMSQVSSNYGHMHKIADRGEAINFALKLARPHDTVAVLGKGHEKSMCFGKIEHPWSDRQAIKKALHSL